MREKFCMRCGTPLNGAAQCPECGYEPQHGEYEVSGSAAPAGQSAPQAENAPVPAPGQPVLQPAAGPAAPEDTPAPQAPAPEAAFAAQPAAPQAQQAGGEACRARCRHAAGGRPGSGAPALCGRGARLWPGARHGAALGRPAGRARTRRAGYALHAACRAGRPAPARGAAVCRTRRLRGTGGLCAALCRMAAPARAPYAGPHRRHAAGGRCAAYRVDCPAHLGV